VAVNQRFSLTREAQTTDPTGVPRATLAEIMALRGCGHRDRQENALVEAKCGQRAMLVEGT
jgi:hypothetical protein